MTAAGDSAAVTSSLIITLNPFFFKAATRDSLDLMIPGPPYTTLEIAFKVLSPICTPLMLIVSLPGPDDMNLDADECTFDVTLITAFFCEVVFDNIKCHYVFLLKDK